LPEILTADNFSPALKQDQQEAERLFLDLDSRATTRERPTGTICFEYSEAKKASRGGRLFHRLEPAIRANLSTHRSPCQQLCGQLNRLFRLQESNKKHVIPRRSTFKAKGFPSQRNFIGVSFDPANDLRQNDGSI
jgi:hypothetical protein